MSEYQYYEFRAIDRALSEVEKKELSTLSSRARITSHQASFVYNYGDFRGNEVQLMERCFDIMLYMADWGSLRLMIRLPVSLVDIKKVALFSVSEEIDCILSEDKKHIILDFNFQDDGSDDWLHAESWLDDLVDLRAELMQGDFRALYLAWLLAAAHIWDDGEVDADLLEPPLPAGLQRLSTAQVAWCKFLGVDKALVAVAAELSKPRQEKKINVALWLDKLPAKEQRKFLLRLAHGEENLSALLNRKLEKMAKKGQIDGAKDVSTNRSIAELLERKDEHKQDQQAEHQRQLEIARQQRLAVLATRQDEAWQEVYDLIEEKKSKSYDKAVAILKGLCDLAHHQDDWQSFKEQVVEIKRCYPGRSALLRKLSSAELID
ncbi:MAG: hypothetical protein Q9O24_10690 [Gammaproteobacteria bacterium]|nr:hypothetical protein [Gammaproteobacteria bacterium]